MVALLVVLVIWVICWLATLRLLTAAWLMDFGKVDHGDLVAFGFIGCLGPIALLAAAIVYWVTKGSNKPPRAPRSPGVIRRLAGNPPERKGR